MRKQEMQHHDASVITPQLKNLSGCRLTQNKAKHPHPRPLKTPPGLSLHSLPPSPCPPAATHYFLQTLGQERVSRLWPLLTLPPRFQLQLEGLSRVETCLLSPSP